LLLVIPILMSLVSRGFTAAFAAPLDLFFFLVRVRRGALRDYALMTAAVEQIGGSVGGRDLERGPPLRERS